MQGENQGMTFDELVQRAAAQGQAAEQLFAELRDILERRADGPGPVRWHNPQACRPSPTSRPPLRSLPPRSASA